MHLNNVQFLLLYPIVLEMQRVEGPEQLEWKILATRFTRAGRKRHLAVSLKKYAEMYPEIESGFIMPGVKLTPSQKASMK